jgi:hypothetical protein
MDGFEEKEFRQILSHDTNVLNLSTGAFTMYSATSLISKFIASYLFTESKESPRGCVSDIDISIVYFIAMERGVGVRLQNVIRRDLNDLTGIYKIDQIQPILDKIKLNPNFTDDEKQMINMSADYMIRNELIDTSKSKKNIFGSKPDVNNRNEKINTLRYDFFNCPRDRYFFIPINLTGVRGGRFSTTGHANAIIINKQRGTVIRIEPGYDNSRPGNRQVVEREDKIKQGIISLVNDIGLKDPTYKEFDATCPQSISLDKNCIFWTSYIFQTMLLNLDKDPVAAINMVSKKPREELLALIENYKLELITKIIPHGLKRYNLAWRDFSDFSERLLRRMKRVPVPTTKAGRRNTHKKRVHSKRRKTYRK